MWVVGAPLLDTVTAVTFTVKYKNNNFKIHKHAHLGSNYTYTPPQFGLKVVGTVKNKTLSNFGRRRYIFVPAAGVPSLSSIIHATHTYYIRVPAP